MILPFRKLFNLPGTYLHGKPTHFRELILCPHYPQLRIVSNEVFRKPKIHTIREDTGGRWRKGRRIDMAYGVRTKQYCQFNVINEKVKGSGYIKELSQCTGTEAIQIQDYYIMPTAPFYSYAYKEKSKKVPDGVTRLKYFIVVIDGRSLTIEEMLQLAINDGFKNLEDFFTWFNKPFTGKIIHWTDHRYDKPVQIVLPFDKQPKHPGFGCGLGSIRMPVDRLLNVDELKKIQGFDDLGKEAISKYGETMHKLTDEVPLGVQTNERPHIGIVASDNFRYGLNHIIRTGLDNSKEGIDEKIDSDNNEYRERNFDCGSDE